MTSFSFLVTITSCSSANYSVTCNILNSDWVIKIWQFDWTIKTSALLDHIIGIECQIPLLAFKSIHGFLHDFIHGLATLHADTSIKLSAYSHKKISSWYIAIETQLHQIRQVRKEKERTNSVLQQQLCKKTLNSLYTF